MRLVYDAPLRQTSQVPKIDVDDNMVAVVLGDSPIRLWGLTPAERIERQLRAERIRVWRDGLARCLRSRSPRAARRLPLRRPRDPRPRQDPAGDARSGRRRAIAAGGGARARGSGRSGRRLAGERLAAAFRDGHRHRGARRDRAGLRSGTEEARSSLRPSGHRRASRRRSSSSRFPARTRASPISSPSGCGPFRRSGSRAGACAWA